MRAVVTPARHIPTLLTSVLRTEKNSILTKAQEQGVHTHGVDIKKAMRNHVGSKNHRLEAETGYSQYAVLCMSVLGRANKSHPAALACREVRLRHKQTFKAAFKISS